MAKRETMNGKTPLPPKPWTVRVAVVLLDLYCVLVVALQVYNGINRRFGPANAMTALMAFLWFGCLDMEVRWGHRWGRWLAVLTAVASLDLLTAFPGWRCLIGILPMVSAAVLLFLPPSGRWFAEAACIEASFPVAAWWKIWRIVYKTLIALPAVLAAIIALVFLPETPGIWKFHRLCSYPGKAALLAAEPGEVTQIVDFTQDGRSYTAVVLTPMSYSPIGPAVIVYNGQGEMVDYRRDSGENFAYLKWPGIWEALEGREQESTAEEDPPESERDTQ